MVDRGARKFSLGRGWNAPVPWFGLSEVFGAGRCLQVELRVGLLRGLRQLGAHLYFAAFIYEESSESGGDWRGWSDWLFAFVQDCVGINVWAGAAGDFAFDRD